MRRTLVRFDWAIKRLLRTKSNFVVLEGFLSELLKEDIRIIEILESEGNQEKEDDKFNRVDILVKNSKDEFIIIEVQNTREYDYFHRMVYGTSKVLTEHIGLGEKYEEVKKIISVNIVYFELGQGKDYVYHGSTVFRGIHSDDILELSKKQKDLFDLQQVHQIFPEYYLLKVNKFDDLAKDSLDEWIYFLKNSAIKPDFSAKGLREANEALNVLKLSEKEYRSYQSYLSNLRDEASYTQTVKKDMEDYIQEVNDEWEKIVLQKELLLKETSSKLEETSSKLEETSSKLEETSSKLEETSSKLEETSSKLEETSSKLEETKSQLLEFEANSEKKINDMILGLFNNGISPEIISKTTDLPIEKIKTILSNK